MTDKIHYGLNLFGVVFMKPAIRCDFTRTPYTTKTLITQEMGYMAQDNTGNPRQGRK
jgi:nucleoside-triphosphatase THEP1